MRILIAEDDLAAQKILTETLRQRGYDVLAVNDGDEAWKSLQGADAPKLAILDWMMPGMDGVEITRQIRQRGDGPYTYIILVTAKTQQKDMIYAMDAGADDYVMKPFDTLELIARVRAGSRLIDLQDQLIESREALRVQATRDPLTGFWNRGAIMDILARDLERARREGTSIGVGMADLDHFKRINDAYGHLAGDSVLREIGKRMSHVVRAYDAIGRYGGEEFLIILSGSDTRSAAGFLERLRTTVNADPILVDDKSISVTLSLGLAVEDGGGKPPDIETLIRAADTALYRAKSGGGNRIELAVTDDLQQKK